MRCRSGGGARRRLERRAGRARIRRRGRRGVFQLPQDSIYGGSNEIQRNIISQMVLGL